MADGALVVGLGNPGPRYAENRHNIGFQVLDALLDRAGGGGWQEKFLGLTARAVLCHRPCLLVKPQTFMNLSGRSAARAARYHRYEIEQLIVVHDELDLPFGTVRVKLGGGTAGHKGLKSLKQDLGDTGFIRVRMGIGRPTHGDVTNFVLSDFSMDEKATLMDIIARGADAVEVVVDQGVVTAMNEFNKRGGGADER